MKYLFCLLIPIGITLLIIGIKHTLRFVNAKILYEMPCIDRLGAAFMDVISKQPVDYSRFSIQVREQIPEFVLILCIFGIIFGSMATMSGIILPIVLK